MKKLKTHSSLKKRIKITGTGKIICNHGYVRHLRRKKTSRALKNVGTRLASKCETVKISKMRLGSLLKSRGI